MVDDKYISGEDWDVHVKFTEDNLPKKSVTEFRYTLEEWEENARYLLARCPHSIRMRPGGGQEMLMESLIATFIKLEMMANK